MSRFPILSFTFYIVLLMAISCSKPQDEFFPTSETFDRMTPEEQADLAPTALFRSIYRNDESEFTQELKNSYVDLVKKNHEGDTALAVAIYLRRENFVLSLTERSTFLDLTVPNKNHRSFVSLLAEFNMESALDIIAEKYFQQLGIAGTLRNNFDDIDFPDDQYRRAHFYAQTASFLDKLQNLWFYGVLRFQNPWDSFFNHRDLEENTFLHHAALFDKTEVIKWYLDRHCIPNALESDDNWWVFQYIGYGSRKVRDFVQDADFLPIRRRFVNLQNAVGNTPLHLAASKGNYRSIELLFQCDRTDATQENHEGQIPLHYLLSTLDKDQEKINDDYKYSAQLFGDKLNPLWGFIPWNNFKSLVNHPDHSGESALHIAARLRDPYFYDLLQMYIMPEQDENGITPRDRIR